MSDVPALCRRWDALDEGGVRSVGVVALRSLQGARVHCGGPAVTDDPPDTRGGRIIEAVAVAVLTAIGTRLVEVIAEHIKKRRSKRKRKPRRESAGAAELEPESDDPVLYAGASLSRLPGWRGP